MLPVGVPVARRPAWFRAALRLLDRLAEVAPRAALRLAGAAGSVSNRLALYGPATAGLRVLFPLFPARRLASLARGVCAADLENRTVDRLVLAGGCEAILSLIEPEAIEAMRRILTGPRPVIIASFHLGPVLSISAAAEATGLPALVIRAERGHRVRPPLEAVWAGGEPDRPAHALRRALEWLQRGQPVIVAVDGEYGSAIGPVPCLGRGIELRRGGFALARLAGAPIVLVRSRWTHGGTGITIDTFDPLPAPPLEPGAPADVERHYATGAARWLERQLTAAPELVSLQVLQMLLRAPSLEGAERSQPA